MTDMDRSQAHDDFASLVDALERNAPVDQQKAEDLLAWIENDPRTSVDVVPGDLGRSIRDMNEEEDRMPGTYAEAAAMLRWSLTE